MIRTRRKNIARQTLGLALLLALPGGAQIARFDGQLVTPASQSAVDSQSPLSDLDPFQEERRLRALNAARQKSLVSDTDKLLKLARELNEEVNGTNPDSITQAEYSKAAEIEKLAHRVKEKMISPVQGSQYYPGFHSPSIP